MNFVGNELWRLRKQFVVTSLGIAGWLSFKYIPYSKFINDTFLLSGTQMRVKHEIDRLRDMGFALKGDEDRLFKLTNHIPVSVIEQAVEDINRSRPSPIDISRVNFSSNLAVLLGTEYHAGSLKNGAFIVLPGTFGLTLKEKQIYMTAKYFDSSSMMFSLLNTNTWKFMVAKELFYLEGERSLMKFSMYLGCFFICTTFAAFYKMNQKFQSKEVIDTFVYNFVRRRKITEKHIMQKQVKNTLAFASVNSFLLAFLVSCLLYKLCLYPYCCWQTRKLDKNLAALGTDYIQGGKNYFEKMQESGYYQHHMLSNKQAFNKMGNPEPKTFLFLLNKVVPREERLEFYTKLAESESET